MRFQDSTPSQHPIMPGVSLALFFIYLEMLKAARSSQWSGLGASDWLGVLVGGLFYTIALTLLVALFAGAAKRFGMRLPAVAIFLSGAIVWGLLSVHREQTPTMDDGIVAAVLAGFGIAVWLTSWMVPVSIQRVTAAFGVFWLSGLTALYSAGQFYLFSPQRAEVVTKYPLMYLSLVGFALAIVLVLRLRTRALCLAASAGVAVPFLVLFGSLHAPARNGEEARPNMVFIISDTLRADYCSAYGGAVATPNLSALAESGVRFDRNYSLAPWTLPAITGLFSSQYPKSLTPDGDHKTWILEMNRYEVDYEVPTLPMRLEEAGYRTGAFTANAFLPVVPGMMFGYEDRASSHPILLEDNGYFNQLPLLSATFRAWLPVLVDIRPHNTTQDLDRYAQAFIRRHRDVPFFLWIHYIDPHAPYDPPEDLRRVHEGPWPFFHPYVGGEEWGIPILGKNFFVAEPDQDYVRSLYEGEITYVDDFVGRIQDALKSAGVADDTYVCFTSDHGEELWDHGEWGHGQSLHDELVRVPWIFSGPGLSPRTISNPVSAIDLVPTLADVLGVAPAESWRGKSLGPVLRGEEEVPADVPIFSLGTSNKSVNNPQYMVVRGTYKLIQIDGGEDVLYDLATDPEEQSNIASENPALVAELGALLDEWLASFSPYFDAMPVEFNREMEQGLEGMGYL